ncbi:MAG: MFS transporter [Actinomycetota bacterium]|nr:MFS transporter [Actinomycetota bacterium]MDQ2957184.1 MFS transporter [Actinomycetota bacterium]
MATSSVDGAARLTAIRRRRVVSLRRWAVAVAVYLIAVFHRTSLGVAGLQAATRFGISPSQLSIFVLLQLGVYAVMQIPTGILVDRYGPRRLLILAAVTMGVAQSMFALAHSYPIALLARALLGLGDALTFVSVLRFAAGQFAPRRYPVVVAITGTLGSIGNVAATLPLTAMLHDAGWTPTFLTAGLLSLISGAAVYLLLPRAPRTSRQSRDLVALRVSAGRVGRRVRTAWSLAGTRVGFWVHFTAMSTSLMFGVLWGVPFLVESQGYSRDGASAMLLASVLVAIVVGPMVGYLIARHPATRVPLAIGTCLATVLGWYAVLAAFSGPVPRLLLVALVLLTGTGAPISGIGFALARDYNGPSIVGTATGVVNVAGFSAAIASCLLVGWTLDLAGSPDRAAYRLAFAVAVSVQLIGLVQMVRWWLRARHASLRALAAGEATPVRIVRHRWDLG